MPRNPFEAMDQRAADAVGRLLAEPCVWHPMVTRAGGAGITVDLGARPDPLRPVRAGLTAIVTWRDEVSDGAPGAGGGKVAGGQLIVDLEESQLTGDKPRKGDRFELPEQDAGERLVSISRAMDDGSTRLLYVCQVVP